MPVDRKKVGEIQKSAWMPIAQFVSKLKNHQGADLKLRWNRERNAFVRLIAVSNDSFTSTELGDKKAFTFPVSEVDGFTFGGLKQDLRNLS